MAPTLRRVVDGIGGTNVGCPESRAGQAGSPEEGWPGSAGGTGVRYAAGGT